MDVKLASILSDVTSLQTNTCVRSKSYLPATGRLFTSGVSIHAGWMTKHLHDCRGELTLLENEAALVFSFLLL